MFAQQRQQQIIELLKKENSVKASKLVDLFKVSLETIRRDLESLEGQGLLKRVHGGAVFNKSNETEQTFLSRELLNKAEKQEIATIASSYIKEGQSIALDVSTTNTELAKVIKQKFERLTILTNSLPIALELAEKPHFTIILVGGMLRNQELCVVGELAESFVSQFHIDTLFLSMSGISLTAGLTDYGVGEVQLKKKLLLMASKCYVVADSSKFDGKSLLKVCDFVDVKGIITDSRLDLTVKKKYNTNGISIIDE
ncbi:DeoR/GlpR family DNA-binding transcription regulator [Metabacillus herbersteinensis]|uniref:DeoR/GlpR family DNA-binding transcription regulator n=1 Tax=Metabacillus herbersteinensis TaxID=283816 RepID=A0ABV6GJP2_9BACI